MNHRFLPFVAAPLLVLLALVPAGSVSAGQYIDPSTLHPVPPSDYSCKAVGGGATCEADRTGSYGPVDTGIVCYSGTSNAFDIYDQGNYHENATRYYDQNLNLTRRVAHDVYNSAEFSNPLAGTAVPYTQHNTITDVFTVPGDPTSYTETNTGENNYTIPHMGSVFISAGRFVTAPDGTIEFQAGPQDFIALGYGDTSVLNELCAALA